MFSPLSSALRALLPVLCIVTLTATALPASAAISGVVFRDFDADGIRDAGEPGVAGAVVTAYDPAGAAAGTSPQVTSATGTYSITGLSGPYRVELSLPAALAFLQPGAVGSDSMTSVVFAADGDTVDFGVNNPADYCQANPRYAVGCYTNGDPDDPSNMAEPAVVSHLYSAIGVSPEASKVTELTQAAVGPVWGIAHDPVSNVLYSGTLLKRHTGLAGSGGIGVIYRTDLGTGTTTTFVDLGAAAGTVPPDSDRFSLPAGSGSTPGRFGDNIDAAAYSLAGTVGFGDLDLSEDGQILYAVNLADREVYAINTVGPPTANVVSGAPWNIANPGGGIARPWGLAVQDGVLYVGVVSDSAPLVFQVYLWDGVSWSTAFSTPVSLGYSRQLSDQFDPPTGWLPWTFTYTGSMVDVLASGGTIDFAVPQAILADIEIEPDGDLVLGFMDRGGLQYGYETPEPDDTNAGDIDILYWPAGDILRAARSGGVWTIEDGSVGSGAACCGPGGAEFYDDLADWTPTQTEFFSHDVGAGALMLKRDTGEVGSTSSDQIRPFSAAVAFYDRADGSRDRRLEIYFDPTATDFSKAGGLGDVELLCVSAPIEIGSRLWCDDVNRNGIQDPGEPGINGATVTLDCGPAGSTTAVTAGDGDYLFTDLGAGVPIPYQASCSLTVDTLALPGAPTGCVQPTFVDVGDPADPGQDLRDSDGSPAGTDSVISFITGAPGENDHSLDFGFRTPPQPLLAAVKTDAIVIDGDMDGMLDGGDTLRYTVMVDNSGDAATLGSIFSSSVDPNSTLVVGSVTTSQGTVTSGNTAGDSAVAIDLGAVAASGSVTITYDVTLNNPVAVGVAELACQGTTTSSNHPPVATDDPDDPAATDPTNTPVDAAPEIALTKVDSLLVDGDMDGRVDAGDTVRYTVMVTNSGDQDAVTAVFTSSVDPNSTLIVGSVTTTQGTVTTGNTAGDTSVGVDLGTLSGAGGSAVITFDVTIDSPIPFGVTQITCQGTVSGGNVPTTPSDDPDDPTGSTDPTGTPLDLGQDLGDAPDTYGTTLGAGGASHVLDSVAGIFLGACVDAEADGQPNSGADGDDTNAGGAATATLGTCAGNDDEDGVSFDTMIVACSMAQITVTSTGGGLLNGWIDFDGSGTFESPAEQIVSDQALGGSDAIVFAVPCSAESGTTFARFRVDATGGLTPTGAAADGEVEDYAVVTKGIDLGDAPDTYTTLQTSGGPSHVVDPLAPMVLGSCVDTEVDGQPSIPANGDDLGAGLSAAGSCTPTGDEDGVVFVGSPAGMPMATLCSTAMLDVTAGLPAGVMAASLDAWIDFNGDGDFDHPAEHLFAGTSAVVTNGTTSLSYTVPCGATPGATYARFRLSTAGSLTPGGVAMDGEIEDYPFLIKGLDYGDAPDTYGTTAGANGPGHVRVDGYSLGANVDIETDGLPSPGADGDDLDGTPDDEDGVTFAMPMPMVAACTNGNSLTVSLTDTAGVGTALLDAWIDFDGDGAFDHPAEHLFGGTSAPLASGSNSLSFDAPCAAVAQASSYARFRLSSAGGLMPTDAPGMPALDGEVEDYVIQVKGADFGDAPDSYGTTLAAGPALHTIIPGYSLGAAEDGEGDGQPSLGADADDLTGVDDEDGVAFATPMPMAAACSTANTLDVTLTNSAGIASAFLDAWIDFDGNGVFDNPAEHLFGGTSAMLTVGLNMLTFNVPCAAVAGDSYARFRLSSTGGLAPNDGVGAAPTIDGEVEDYAVLVKAADFGDAPDSYGTTQAANGPIHSVIVGYSLGTAEDGEADGQPSVGADGDDLAGSPDDEDGVTFATVMPMVVACETSPIDVTLTDTAGVGTALLDGWIDFDGDGTFDHPSEHLFGGTSAPLVAGVNSLSFDVPCTAIPGGSYGRFRLSSVGGLTPLGGPVADGEIEDYAVLVKGLDFGDAPEGVGYPTLLSSDGARHVVLATANPSLGPAVDEEPDGQPSAAHDGDDVAGSPDDEDGVSMPVDPIIPGKSFQIEVTGGATGGLLNAWVDFDRDGAWSPAEQIATDLAVGAGATVTVTASVPLTAVTGPSCGRFRLSSAGGLTPTGRAPDGEVEDHPIEIGIKDPEIGVGLELIGVTRNDLTNTHLAELEIVVINSGTVPLSSVQLSSDLETCFEGAGSWTSAYVTSSDLTVNPSFDGSTDMNLLDGSDEIPANFIGYVALGVEVFPAGNPGPYVCQVAAEGTWVGGGVVVTDLSQNGGDPDPNGNGDPGDDNEPTPVVFELPPVEIPTLGEWGLISLALLLAILGAGVIRRRFDPV